jgi:hypothetical protein
LFTTGYERLAEGGHEAFAFALGLFPEAFAFGFWAFGFLVWVDFEGKKNC